MEILAEKSFDHDHNNFTVEELTEHLNKLKSTLFKCSCGSSTNNPLSYSNHINQKHNRIAPSDSSHTLAQANSIRNEILRVKRKLKL